MGPASVRPRGFIGGIEVFRADPLIKFAECRGGLPCELIPFPILKARGVGQDRALDQLREQAGSVQEFMTAKGSRSEIVEGG